MKFIPFVTCFDFSFISLSNSFDCCSPACPAVGRESCSICEPYLGPQIQENICWMHLPVTAEALLWDRPHSEGLP